MRGHIEIGNAINKDTKLFGNASYKLGMTSIAASGAYSLNNKAGDDMGFSLAVLQKLSKDTMAYAGWGMALPGLAGVENQQLWSLGLKYKF